MKIHLYIAMLWVISLLAGCNDVTVGYLYTTEASYSMDTLQVTRFSALEDNINELERVFEKYTPEIQNDVHIRPAPILVAKPPFPFPVMRSIPN